MILHKNNEKHEFSLYWPMLSDQLRYRDNQTLHCNDTALIHRIVIVLRKSIGSSFILFDHMVHVRVVLHEIYKKNIVLTIMSIHENTILKPAIRMILPLLKRDFLEQAVYSLVEVGINDIQLVITEKVQKNIQAKEYERLKKIIIAASEQSKNYASVHLHPPLMLHEILNTLEPRTTRLYADPLGVRLYPLSQTLVPNNLSNLVLMIGPEGDLTADEKELLKQNSFIFCALTPTIIQSVHAAGLFAGIWRSLLR